MKILLTGFGQFGDFDTNPSTLVVEAFEMPGIQIRKAFFEVNQPAIDSRYNNILDSFQPDLILNIGLNAASGAINIETFAINSLKDSNHFMDNDKEIAFKTRLDTNSISQVVCDKGIPCIRSNYAGSYYCNYIFYQSLSWCSNNGGNALFIHIPFNSRLAAEICKEKKIAYPSLPLSMLIEALTLIIDEVSKEVPIS